MINATKENGIEDVNVEGYAPLMSPHNLKLQIPLTPEGRETVRRARQSIKNILDGRDDRKIIVVGPCSMHDEEVAKEYAERQRELSDKVEDRFVLVMRTYFEKPRTTVGWKGLIYEPNLDGQEALNEGLSKARGILVYNAGIGLPSATEFLDTFIPQYTADGVSWGAIGARTAESPMHRQMASGLSMPIGIKNTTQGDVGAAINGVIASRHQHYFFGIDEYGTPCVVFTKGNKYAHLVLRGGNDGPNYYAENIQRAQEMLRIAGLEDRLMIDCSHGNSRKDHTKQPEVFLDGLGQMVDGNSGIIGWMLESNIKEGRQKIPDDLNGFDKSTLKFGVSITDTCIDWETTRDLILEAHRAFSSTSIPVP